MVETTKPKRYWLFRLCATMLRGVASILLKIEIEGFDRIPLTGPVLLIGNHVNFIDRGVGLHLCSGATSRG